MRSGSHGQKTETVALSWCRVVGVWGEDSARRGHFLSLNLKWSSHVVSTCSSGGGAVLENLGSF